MASNESPWTQFKEDKQPMEEEWRSGVCYNLMQEFDVFWMTLFCFPCQVGREWQALMANKSYSTNWAITALACLCPILSPCLVCKLRTAMRKMPDATTEKTDMKSWIPGTPTEDFVCALCCTLCTVCHIGRELKIRSFPTGTLCMHCGLA
eukprot:TRINITY_DN535_c2_g1_i1.p2 TRINITY_DN535_c2_g1~~TRINITY_DN535_c2_g1_i1.p2  ORF type:complete len:150 (+),score=56.00 TRINITY_DN535_c2_g1_i1:71-520(+)